ncbi:MAG: hypothetical protein EPO21_12465 [Chloroflexota bacterium]|nr:MAG: hypothetical protein EPO21_12465 [Chloroflexota bacterium]
MSKKQQHKEKRRHKEKKRGIARIGLEALERKVRSEAIFGGSEVVFQTGSSEKMSEVLLAFVEPYQEYATTRDAFERLIAIGVVAWNAALVSPEDRHSLLDETSKSIQESAGKEDAEVYKALVNDLIKRKERYFASNKRVIVTYQVTEGKGKFHLAVASSPAEWTS